MCELISYIKGCSVINRIFLLKIRSSGNYVLRFSFDVCELVLHKSRFDIENSFKIKEMIYGYV